MREIGLLLALRGDIEQCLLATIEDRHDLVVTRRCVDLAEVLAAARAGIGQLAIIDIDMGVDRALIARLTDSGVTTAVLVDAHRGHQPHTMGAHALRDDSEQLLPAIEALADQIRDRNTARVAPSGDDDRAGIPEPAGLPGLTGPAEPARSSASAGSPGSSASPGSSGSSESAEPRPAGRIITITGPAGSPGRTSVAINLAAELTALGATSSVIDADIWASSIAASFALTDTTAGLAAAVRAADRGTLDAAGLQRLYLPVTAGLQVLAGISRAHRWREVSTPGLESVWQSARASADITVIDAPIMVPDEEGDHFDQLGPRRNAVVNSALDAADEVVVVGAAEPIGIERLVSFLLDLREHRPQIEPTVVVNRLRPSAAGPRPHESVQEALGRFAGISHPHLIADDRSAMDRALLAGGVLVEIAPRSPARAELTALAHRLGTAIPARRPRQRRRRRRSREQLA